MALALPVPAFGFASREDEALTEPGLEGAMGRYARGDDAALGDVYDLLAPSLCSFLVRTCRDAALAEDLTHETFLRIVRSRDTYRAGARVLPWAYAIGRRLFLDHLRSRRRDGPSLDTSWDDDGPVLDVPAADNLVDDHLDAVRMLERVENVLAGLPERQATAFRLLKHEGLTIAEAAAVLGTTETSVKLRAHRAYQALRAALPNRGATG
jgi:RNA polymerase sigma-70 factor (ECF subfamily)